MKNYKVESFFFFSPKEYISQKMDVSKQDRTPSLGFKRSVCLGLRGRCGVGLELRKQGAFRKPLLMPAAEIRRLLISVGNLGCFIADQLLLAFQGLAVLPRYLLVCGQAPRFPGPGAGPRVIPGEMRPEVT